MWIVSCIYALGKSHAFPLLGILTARSLFWRVLFKFYISVQSPPFWAFPLFSLFLLHAARGLCSRPRELTVVIMVLTMKGLKLLLGFFSFNESEKSGGDKSKSRRWRQRERFHVHERIKNRHWKSCLQKKKHSIHHMKEVSKTTKQFTKLCSFTLTTWNRI